MVKLEKNEHSYILYLDSPFVNIVLHLLSLFLSIIFYFVKYLILFLTINCELLQALYP